MDCLTASEKFHPPPSVKFQKFLSSNLGSVRGTSSYPREVLHHTMTLFQDCQSTREVHERDYLPRIMDADIIVSLDRLKKRRQLWEKLDEEDGAVDQSDDELDDRQIMTRRFYEREGHKKSFWYQFVHERDLTDLNGRDGKLFRNRFTVPYPLYLQLLVLAERWFPQKKYDVCGRETTPVFLKLLGTLRMLGKGCSWDLLYELSGVSAEVHRKWTLNFIDKFSKEMYQVYVHGPRNFCLHHVDPKRLCRSRGGVCIPVSRGFGQD
jgi:hypothetical protein